MKADKPPYPGPTLQHDTREGWLLAALRVLRSPLAQVGAAVPDDLLVSVGFNARNARKTMGVCFPLTEPGGRLHIFISPSIDDPVTVLATLVHEAIHASDNCASQHRGHFAKAARAIGLSGKLTATIAGPELRLMLSEIADELGPYPHARLRLAEAKIKKQGTRNLKAQCGDENCPHIRQGKRPTIRITKEWAGEITMPVCACGRRFMLADEIEKETDDA